jgi:hypothetical protein
MKGIWPLSDLLFQTKTAAPGPAVFVLNFAAAAPVAALLVCVISIPYSITEAG